MKVASTVRGGGHATPFGPTVPTLPFQWLIQQVEGRMIVLMRHDSACCITTQVDGKSEDLPEVSRLT
jgi:hypothetical protein